MRPVHQLLILGIFVGSVGCLPKPADSTAASKPVPFSLEELQRRTFHYFWDLADSTYGQIPDRYPTLTFSSIAATGFGLSSYIVGVKNGFVSRSDAAARTLLTLEALWEMPQGDSPTEVSGYRGFFYHFLTLDRARRFKQVELSTIDTGLLMAGVLSVQSYFDQDNPTERAIRAVADSLYRRVEWDWVLNDSLRLSMGWHPEKGFLASDWQGYNEAMILLVLALGSPTHPIPAECWAKWCSTYPWETFEGQEHINFDPLFGHQYSQMYIDFRGIQDPFLRRHKLDYFENARRATLANRAYCIRNPQGFTGYGENQWGLTACDGPAYDRRPWQQDTVTFMEYSARGAASTRIVDDGTIAPTAAGGSIPFAPEVCIPALEYMWNTHYDQLVDTFGFRDAYNLSYTFQPGMERGWFDKDYLGIDQGPIVLQIENYRSGLIWEVMRKNPYIQRGLQRAGFEGGWLEKRDIAPPTKTAPK